MTIGDGKVVVMAGPCSVESRDQIERAADIVAEGGASVIRGGAFKPRSSPYSFQGMGEEGLKLLRAAADRHGLLVISEVMDSTQIPLLAAYADILQIGARNMQNFNLLRESANCASRCCSSAASPPPSKSFCSRPNIFSRAEIMK